MKLQRRVLVSSLLLAMLSGQAAQAADGAASLVQRYCIGCHNQEDWAGSLTLDDLDPAQPAHAAEVWEKVLRKLQAGMMPPAGEPRPSDADVADFVSTLTRELDSGSTPQVATPALHRLNRTEYRNAIRDLLALDIDTSTLLPLDNSSEGFDNVATGLGFSPALIQGYTAAAQKISRQALGDPSSGETAVAINAPPLWRQDQHLDGLPLGTRGGLRAEHYFPLDAEYEISVQGGPGFARVQSASIVLTLDGMPLQVENPRHFRLPLAAGTHVLTVALLDQTRPTGVNDIYSVYSPPGSINGVQIKGPYNATGAGMPPSRQKVFSCYPANNDEEGACARRVLGDLATQAFRAPVAADELEAVMQFYARGHQEGGFEAGIQQGLSRILVDPRFLFRFEEEPEGIAPGTAYAISDLELASRLSFFLWSSIPDQTLLELAAAGTLHQPAVLQAQVQRMLGDARAQSLVENFAGQWLRLRELSTLTPETPAFNDNLRAAFITETQMLLGSVIAEDRPLRTLLDADYTFLNERLAKHYGISGVHGDYFRRVELPADSPRRGLLGHASLLTVTSTASRTSPVIRGSWILENLLHAPVPAPPPGVETNLDGDGSAVLTSSVRERLEQHRQDPSCNSCHSVIDPVGFALENFDMIGAWRERDGDSLVDASGVLADGTPVKGPADLRAALLRNEGLFVSTFTEKLLTYALGRKLEYYDMPQVRAILRTAAPTEHRFSALITALVQSPLFLQRTAAATTESQVATTAGSAAP
jgi:cytochrome c551/c552